MYFNDIASTISKSLDDNGHCISPFHFGEEMRDAVDFWFAMAALTGMYLVLSNYQ